MFKKVLFFFKNLSPFGIILTSFIAASLFYDIGVTYYLWKEPKETQVIVIEGDKDFPLPKPVYRPRTITAANKLDASDYSKNILYMECPFCKKVYQVDKNGIFVDHVFVLIHISEKRSFQTCEDNWASFLMRSTNGKVIDN